MHAVLLVLLCLATHRGTSRRNYAAISPFCSVRFHCEQCSGPKFHMDWCSMLPLN